MATLPARPSAEHLRKEARRVSRATSVRLAHAQRALANDYGFRTWAHLIQHVARVRGEESSASPLFTAVRAGDVEAVKRVLAAGANPRAGDGREAPLHAAARRGPLAVVEALIAGGALEWQTDAVGRTPLDVARRNRPKERGAIIALLDRNRISDPSFRSAVAAIHAGDVAKLSRLLEAEPRLLRERSRGPEAYRAAQRHDYFRDPKLLWFVAYNPAIAERMPPNITDVAQAMIARGAERPDLDYTLGLVMSSATAREQGHQIALMRVLIRGGATPDEGAIVVAAAHKELEPLRALLESGHPLTAPIAAALGDDAALAELLTNASRDDVQTAFGLAVINDRLESVRHALAAGADADAYLPVHAHSTALHTAAIDGNVALVELLLAHGARTGQRDKLWDGTPLDWAIYGRRDATRALLEHGPRTGFRSPRVPDARS